MTARGYISLGEIAVKLHTAAQEAVMVQRWSEDNFFRTEALKLRRRATQQFDRERREAIMVRAIAYEQLAERDEEQRREPRKP